MGGAIQLKHAQTCVFSPTWNQNYLCKFENFVSFRGIFYFHRKKSILALSCRHVYNSLYLLKWLKKFCQFFNYRNYPKIIVSIQTFGSESIMVECFFIFHGRKLIRVFLYCLGKTRGPIIYFFDRRSPSRYFLHLDSKKVP